MPYTIVRENDQHYVYKVDADGNPTEKVACHDNRPDAVGQIGAIESSEAKEHAPRFMLIVTSNAYKDREGEIITQKALQDYVDNNWDGDTWKGTNPLLWWHDGEPIGEIIWADMRGPFLVEIAKEYVNAVVNLNSRDEMPLFVLASKVWDAVEANHGEIGFGASHEFKYLVEDREDKVYEQIDKVETTVLPITDAANTFTYAIVFRS